MADSLLRAFVCGYPIGHSRSPIIHNYWLTQHGIDGVYERKSIPHDEFASFLRRLPQSCFVGGNVTIPYKESAHRLIENRDTAAGVIGAVNTVWLENDRLCGGNTDAYGFAANLDATVPDWADRSVATVLGAGGAARAVIHALQERRFQHIRIVNRTIARANALMDRFGTPVSAHSWSALPELLPDTDLLVNTTSLGMSGTPEIGIDLSNIPASAVVNDIVYVPLETSLLRQARGKGLQTVDGLGMLLHQAVPGFEQWFGVRPEVTPQLRKIVLADLEEKS